MYTLNIPQINILIGWFGILFLIPRCSTSKHCLQQQSGKIKLQSKITITAELPKHDCLRQALLLKISIRKT